MRVYQYVLDIDETYAVIRIDGWAIAGMSIQQFWMESRDSPYHPYFPLGDDYGV